MTLEFKILAALALVVALLVGARVEIARHDDAVRAAQMAVATAAARVEDNRRETVDSEINNETQRLAARDRTVALAASASVSGLHDRAAPLFAQLSSCPAVAGPGPAASSPADLLADVQRRLLEAGGQLAAEADARRTAGLSVERKYDALTTNVPK